MRYLLLVIYMYVFAIVLLLLTIVESVEIHTTSGVLGDIYLYHTGLSDVALGHLHLLSGCIFDNKTTLQHT
jgi:hypothetical protein